MIALKIWLLFIIPVFASVKVAFVEIRTSSGELVQLEKNGRFAHIAISYKNQWLHSHPYRGVELVSQVELEKMGAIGSMIEISHIDEIEDEQVKKYLGKSYDPTFSWDDDRIYCSELVAKILKIDPTPMNFKSEVWMDYQQKNYTALGISPDEIYENLNKKGSCTKIFSGQ